MSKGNKLDWGLLFILILAIIAAEAVIKPLIGFTRVKVLEATAGAVTS